MRTQSIYEPVRTLIPVWIEHGIPTDSTTQEAARKAVAALVSEVEEVWSIVDQLLDGRDPVCGMCRADVQPSLFGGAT